MVPVCRPAAALVVLVVVVMPVIQQVQDLQHQDKEILVELLVQTMEVVVVVPVE